MIFISLTILIAACMIIWKVGDSFETASSYLGRNLNEGVRGATINAIGSSMPELLTTFFFLFILKDKEGFAAGIGATAGSAIFNSTIIPASVILVVFIKKISSIIQISKKVILRDGIFLIFGELLLIFILGFNKLSWHHGLILISYYVVYALYTVYSMKTSESKPNESQASISKNLNSNPAVTTNSFLNFNLQNSILKGKINTSRAWTLLIISTAIMGIACFFLVKACEMLGDAIGLPLFFVALILASMATSVPDTILSIKDAKKGKFNDAIANALGSNIFDICFVLGFPIFLFTICYGPLTIGADSLQSVSTLRILLVILTTIVVLLLFLYTKLTRITAFLLLLIYIAFLYYVIDKAFNFHSLQMIERGLQYFNELLMSISFH